MCHSAGITEYDSSVSAARKTHSLILSLVSSVAFQVTFPFVPWTCIDLLILDKSCFLFHFPQQHK